MKKLVTVIIFALATQFALAQKFTIKGKVVDETGGGLPSATVMVLSQKDSALVSFKGTNVEGVFEVANLNMGTYLLKITYIGYNNFFKTVSGVAGTPVLEVGDLKLQPSSAQLEEVVIKGEANPVTVKRDTIEFSAGSFKTAVNANVEDLLKKLPGVEVDADGVVTAQGETVQQVLVDGREFFGRDPKLATRGLPADAVKSVQVFDKKSDQARFSGIDDGVRQKTINLELKEDRQNMTFGNVMAGAGADIKDSKLKLSNDEDSRFTAKASINRFGKGKQLSIVGMGNNVNEQGFTASDLGGGGGGGGGGGAGIPSGIATNYAAGINFNKDLSKKSKLTSNYFYNHTDRDLITGTDRLNIFTSGNNIYTGITKQLATTDNHRATLRIDQDLDSANSITFVATPSYTKTDNNSTTVATTTKDDEAKTIINTLASENISLQTSTNVTSNLLWRHRFAKPGRTLSTNLTLAITDAKTDGSQNSTNKYPGTGQPDKITDQTSTQKTGNQTYGATLNYTEPAGQNKYLEFSYDFRTNINQIDKKVFDENSGTSIENSLFSNKYHSNYLYNRPGTSFRFTRPMYNITVGTSYQYSTLNGTLRDTVKIDRVFQKILPILRMNYDFTQFKHLRLNYQTSMIEPTITQLNPVIDNSNPINLSVGNPNLQVGYSHNSTLNYTSFDPARFINFFANLGATYTLNPIVTSQLNDPTTGIRTSIPVNVKDNLNLNANLNFGFPITPLKSRFNIGPNIRYSKGLNVIDLVGSTTIQQTIGGRARYNLQIDNVLNFELGALITNQATKYENTLAGSNQVYLNKVYSAELTMPFYKSYWQLRSNFDYYMNDSKTSDVHTRIPMFNAALSRFILKNKAGEIKLAVNNILNKGSNVTVSNTGTSQSTSTTNNLARYFMVTFTYALNKNLNPAAGRGQGGPSGGGFRD